MEHKSLGKQNSSEFCRFLCAMSGVFSSKRAWTKCINWIGMVQWQCYNKCNSMSFIWNLCILWCCVYMTSECEQRTKLMCLCRFFACWNDMKLSWMYKISHFSLVFKLQSTKIEQNTNVTRQSMQNTTRRSFRLVAVAFASFFRHNHCLSFQYAKCMVWQNEWMRKMCAVTLNAKASLNPLYPCIHIYYLGSTD